MADYRQQIAEIRYGTGYASVLTFLIWFDGQDAYSEPRVAARVRANRTGTRTSGRDYGHDQRLRGTVRRIPRADVVLATRTISGWPAWRAFFRDAWDLKPWRWVYVAGTYGGASTYFDAELESPDPLWEDGPDLEANGMRRVELVIARKNGTRVTGAAVEGY
jgi:hypothetical protein